MPIRTIEDC